MTLSQDNLKLGLRPLMALITTKPFILAKWSASKVIDNLQTKKEKAEQIYPVFSFFTRLIFPKWT